MEPHWYVLYTMPQHEKKVAAYFAEKRIEHYLPLIKRKRQWSDRIKLIDFPLFPGYIFVRFDWASQYPEIFMHHGILNVVRLEGSPVVIEDIEFERLKALIIYAKDIQSDPERHLPPGQKVEIRTGPFKGLSGVVARVKNKNRLFVRVAALDRVISAEIDVIDVEKAD